MKPLPTFLIGLGLIAAFVFQVAQWIAAPSSFAALHLSEASAHGNLLSDGKNRLEISTESESIRFSCGVAPRVCQHVSKHPNIDLHVVIASPEAIPAYWLIVARTEDRALLQLAESEARLKYYKLSLLGGIFLVGTLLAGLIYQFSKQRNKNAA